MSNLSAPHRERLPFVVCLVALAVCVVASVLAVILMGSHMDIPLVCYGEEGTTPQPTFVVGDIEGNPVDGVADVELVKSPSEEGHWILSVDAVSPGTVWVNIDWDDVMHEGHRVDVLPFNVVVSSGETSGGFVCMILACLWLVLVSMVSIWQSAVLLRRDLCSYRTVSTLSIAVLCTSLTLVLLYYAQCLWAEVENISPYLVIRAISPILAMLDVVTFPILALVLLAVCASNVMLVRREGFGLRNVLGVVFMAFFAVGLLFISVLPVSSGSELEVRLWSAVSAVAAIVVGYIEILLVCTSICAFAAAFGKPTLDRDFVVVLGCALFKDGSPTPLLSGRCDGAAKLYGEQAQGGNPPTIICSGGKGDDEVCSEASSMQNYLMGQGIPRDALALEDRSTNTRENMRYSLDLARNMTGREADELKFAYSTTNYHVFRAGIYAGECGMKAQGIGCPTKWYFWPNAFLREFVGFLAVKWRLHAVILGIAVVCACLIELVL